MTFLACATLLTSAVLVTSCNNKDQNEPQQQAEVVKTEFAISLPDKVSGGPNKMSAATVQTSSFLGMTDIILVPFTKTSAIASGDARLGTKNINLVGGVPAAGQAGTLGANSNAKVFSDVEVPRNTASFLFYAKSAQNTSNKFADGSLCADTDADGKTYAGDYSFKLDSIITPSDFNTLMTTGVGGQLMTLLTSIANASDGSQKWYEYTAVDDQAVYDKFQIFKTIHGLSSFEVARILTDVYQSLKPHRAEKLIYDAILDVIDAATTLVSVNNETGVVTMKTGYDQFPQSANLPEGSIDIVWDDADRFIQGAYSGMAAPTKYVYPVGLWYYANSTIKTSNSSQKSMYNDVNTWAQIVAAHNSDTKVTGNTRAIVLVDSVQYAVARLDTKIRLGAASLVDNSDLAEGLATNVNCMVNGGFPVKAILVGGQNHVRYDFTPAEAGAYTVYDTVIASAPQKAANDVYTTPNHTLVLESFANSNVQIAVEMENNTGVDFYGHNNQLIPKNGKFYVVATLDAAAATETGSKVFKQDFVTTAQLTLNSLRSAYNTIPDLRSPELEVGFAVSLTWQNGHDYNNIVIP